MVDLLIFVIRLWRLKNHTSEPNILRLNHLLFHLAIWGLWISSLVFAWDDMVMHGELNTAPAFIFLFIFVIEIPRCVHYLSICLIILLLSLWILNYILTDRRQRIENLNHIRFQRRSGSLVIHAENQPNPQFQQNNNEIVQEDQQQRVNFILQINS